MKWTVCAEIILTPAATEALRIASAKIDWNLNKLADLRRTELKDEDARIYPGSYAPLLVAGFPAGPNLSFLL